MQCWASSNEVKFVSETKRLESYNFLLLEQSQSADGRPA